MPVVFLIFKIFGKTTTKYPIQSRFSFKELKEIIIKQETMYILTRIIKVE